MQRDCTAIAPRLQRDCSAIAARLQRDCSGCNAIALRLHRGCSAIAARLQRDCSAIAARLQRDCNEIVPFDCPIFGSSYSLIFPPTSPHFPSPHCPHSLRTDEKVIKEKLSGYITSSADGAVTMLSFKSCPFCISAREILAEKGVTYKDIMIDGTPDSAPLRVELMKQFGQTSVPAIWVDQQFIGGCNNGGLGGLKPLVRFSMSYFRVSGSGGI
jgi:glutaredoxin 3